MQLNKNGFPRRNDLEVNTPVELAIRHVIDLVEGLGAHTYLTEAVTLLDSARHKVADWIELENGGRSSAH